MAVRAIATLSFKPEILRQIDALADAQNLSRSQLVEKLIREKLEEEERNVKVLGNPVVMRAMMQAFSDPAVVKGFAAAVSDKLEPEQLELFHRSLSNLNAAAAEASVQRVREPRTKPLRKKKRGGK